MNTSNTFEHKAVTVTKRLVSPYLNLQNIPIRTVESRKIQQAFYNIHPIWLHDHKYKQIKAAISICNRLQGSATKLRHIKRLFVMLNKERAKVKKAQKELAQCFSARYNFNT